MIVDSSFECWSEVSGMVLFEEHIIKMAAGCMFCSSNRRHPSDWFMYKSANSNKRNTTVIDGAQNGGRRN